MLQSRKYEGVGVLTVRGKKFEGIHYRFEARLINNEVMADGLLSINPATGAMAGYQSGGAKLQLQTGETVSIVVTEATSSIARIKIPGPIPGFP